MKLLATLVVVSVGLGVAGIAASRYWNPRHPETTGQSPVASIDTHKTPDSKPTNREPTATNQGADTETFLREGNELLSKGEPTKALRRFGEVLKQFPIPGDDRRKCALLGQARANALLPPIDWPQIRSDIKEIADFAKFSSAETACLRLLGVLSVWTEAGKSAADTLDDLAALKGNGELPRVEAEFLQAQSDLVVRAALAEADKALEEGNQQATIDTALRIVGKVLRYEPGHSEAQSFKKELNVLAALQGRGAKVDSAELKNLLQTQDPKRPFILMLALNRSVLADPTHHLENALAGLVAARKLTSIQESKRSEFNELYTRVSKIKQVMGKGSIQKNDFVEFLLSLEKVPADSVTPWVQAWKAECLLETGGDRTAAETLAEQALVSLVQIPYAQYVRALAFWRSRKQGEAEKSAVEMYKAYSASVEPEELQASSRRKQAIQILGETAKGLRSPEGGFLKPCFGKEKLDLAFIWLKKALQLYQALQQMPPDDVRLYFALAAGERKDSDDKEVDEFIEALLVRPGAKELGRDGLALLLLAARRLEAKKTVASQRAALIKYDLACVLAIANRELTLSPLELYDAVLSPALTLGDQLVDGAMADQALKTKVAALHAAKGLLIHRNRNEEWQFKGPSNAKKNPIREEFDAYDRAAILDDTQAEYFAGRGDARGAMLDPSDDRSKLQAALALIKNDGELAIQKDSAKKEVPGGHNLLGFVLYYQSTWSASVAEKLDLLEKAVAEFSQAIDICGPRAALTRDLASNLKNRMAIRVLIANLADADEKRKSSLEQAKADGRRVATMTGQVLDTTYVGIGNTLEDLRQYDDARTAFTGAIRASGNKRQKAKSLLGRGRLQYKWRAYDPAAPDTLFDDAVEDLGDAVKLEPELAEAHYWLSKTFLARGKLGDRGAADASFDLAIRHGKDPKQKAIYVIEAVEDAALADNFKRSQSLIDMLPQDYSLEIALLKGFILERQKQSEEAFAIFDSAIASGRVSPIPNTAAKLRFRRALSRFVSTKLWTIDARLDKPLTIEDADQAAELAGNDIAIRVEALVLAAEARRKLIDEPGKTKEVKDTYFTAARAGYQQALNLIPKGTHSWRWRGALAQLLYDRISKHDGELSLYFKDAQEMAGQAYDLAPSREDKDRIGTLKRNLADLEKK